MKIFNIIKLLQFVLPSHKDHYVNGSTDMSFSVINAQSNAYHSTGEKLET
jgi:hypothetical protein